MFEMKTSSLFVYFSGNVDDVFQTFHDKNMSHPDFSFCFLQTFLRVRANRHTRLNGTLTGLTVVFHCC